MKKRAYICQTIAHILPKYQNMSANLKKTKTARKVYVVKRGLKTCIYSNVSVMAREEKLDYWKLYGKLKRNGVFAAPDIFIEKKEVLSK